MESVVEVNPNYNQKFTRVPKWRDDIVFLQGVLVNNRTWLCHLHTASSSTRNTVR